MSGKARLATLSPVIVIDDDEFFRVAIDTVLRKSFGVEKVVICETAQHAVEELSNGTSFGLSLVDLNISGIDNRHLLDTFKTAQPESRLVVLSASRAREDILMALSLGAQGFINKGLGIAETGAALQQIADGAVYVPPFTPQSEDEAAGSETEGEISSDALAALTPRQIEVLRLLVEGHPNKGIARELDINPSTVKFHLSFIFQILGVSNRVEAAMLGTKLLNEGE